MMQYNCTGVIVNNSLVEMIRSPEQKKFIYFQYYAIWCIEKDGSKLLLQFSHLMLLRQL